MNNLKKVIIVTLLISIFMIGGVSAMDEMPTKTKTSHSKITKANLSVFAPSTTNSYKQSQKLK